MAAAGVVDLDFVDEAVAQEGRYTGSVADLDFLATDSTRLVRVASEEVAEVLHAVVVDSTLAYSEDAVGFPLVRAARVVVLVEPVFVVVDLWLQRVALLQRRQKVWVGIRRCWISDVPSIRTLCSSPEGFQLTSQASLQCARYG
jgi:hypothetical protein